MSPAARDWIHRNMTMQQKIIDLRSDTVTRPTKGMRQAMADAEVGDDVFGDDPTVIRLETRVAELFGMQRAVFVPSGTMANQISIRAHTEPGNEIICHESSHVYLYEGGAPAALAGCSLRLLTGERGMFSADDVERAIRPDDQHFPKTTLVVVENTQNRGGGSVWSLDAIAAIRDVARKHGLKMHLDGARILNACVAAKASPAGYARHFDSATICFSKGLGAPVGSAVAGSTEFIARARRFRKMYGGAMRQAGILAAAAEYALNHHVERLADDHQNARVLADALSACGCLKVVPPETNIVYFDIDEKLGTAKQFAESLRDRGVWTIPVAPQRIRAVTHLDVSPSDIQRAGDVTVMLADSSA
jgi:threonine aldolase